MTSKKASQVSKITWTTINPKTGLPRGSIGDLSVQIGYDVRDLLMEGYDQDEIDGIIRGEYTLEELLRRGPKKRPTDAAARRSG
ncbi:MAG: hypothetical protein HY335_07370 [Deinococcus sp.]|nr:hypothetical protein [Deinococcus sp.]